MEKDAHGTFDIDITPDAAPGPIGRFTLAKRFHGSLDATSTGAMLTFRSAVPGSAGYVAIEQVTGTLDGHAGSFVLQHSGLMDKGAPSATIGVVPDSGTGALAGLRGEMSITGETASHAYVFRYRLV